MGVGTCGTNWPEVLQSVGVIVGFAFTAFAIYLDVRARRAASLFEITKQHRDIWALSRDPELARVNDPTADPRKHPPTPAEEMFIGFLILHLSASYHAMKAGVLVRPEGLRADIRQFFSRPIVKAVWERLRQFQDRKFLTFIEKTLRAGDSAGE